MSIMIYLLLATSMLCIVHAEYTPDTIEWSAETCREHGLDKRGFELCAALEFCSGSGRRLDDGSLRRALTEDDEAQAEYEAYMNNLYGVGETAPLDKGVPTAAKFGWRIAGSKSCTTPGPLMRVDRGKRYGIVVSNASGETTNLHFHGLHAGGSDDVTRSVHPGDLSLYNLTIPDYHMGGTFFYHSHTHGSVQRQVGGGAFGMLVVNDGDVTEDLNVREFLKNERTLILDNVRSRMTANGLSRDIYELFGGEWYRFRILHVNVDARQSGVRIQFGSSCEVRPIAHDGILRFVVPGPVKEELYLTSASRLDVALRCNATSTLSVEGNPLVTFEVDKKTKSQASPLEKGTLPWSSNRPFYLTDLLHENVGNTWTVNVYETSLNDQSYDLQKPLCGDGNRDFRYGQVNEWLLRGTVGHPFHVHRYPMQIIGNCGKEHEVGEFYDTIAADQDCMVRLRLTDVAGRAMMHCHILQHEDQGAMGFINVIHGPQETMDLRTLTCASGQKECDPIPPEALCVPEKPMVHVIPQGPRPEMGDAKDTVQAVVPMDMSMDDDEDGTDVYANKYQPMDEIKHSNEQKTKPPPSISEDDEMDSVSSSSSQDEVPLLEQPWEEQESTQEEVPEPTTKESLNERHVNLTKMILLVVGACLLLIMSIDLHLRRRRNTTYSMDDFSVNDDPYMDELSSRGDSSSNNSSESERTEQWRDLLHRTTLNMEEPTPTLIKKESSWFLSK